MLEGKDLGDAIREVIRLWGKTERQVAEKYEIEQPSVNGWKRTGRISKTLLQRLIEDTSHLVGPNHWGLPAKAGQPNLSAHALRLARLFDALPAELKAKAYADAQQVLRPPQAQELPPLQPDDADAKPRRQPRAPQPPRAPKHPRDRVK